MRGENIDPDLFEPAAKAIMKFCFGAKDMNGMMQMVKQDSAKCTFSMTGFGFPLENGVKEANSRQ